LTVKNKLLGEAYFIRGLTYLYLVRIWGSVPLSLTAIESTEQAIDNDGVAVALPRADEITVMKQSLNDAQKAASLLGYTAKSSREWGIRASKGAAQALIAHAALWIASRGSESEMNNYLSICTK